ncbi:peroxisomal trans-2-enoyl-CoA reductase-like [Argiope bruennichi]|uniref:Peroxisomal trans-2-enoyl-CoA reductase n=1 Tax=Argiope bruennichi TaxID=94029 RepID=A0A8T0FL25_ARGBR|nr:peroxisomal trans-2-enoyl-CoA reductase-like [Argiope bruennichi]KAF8790918.1 Peroxisomal trans-2-enoyl-CoA reductase like protein [Argiope bruennichi]
MASSKIQSIFRPGLFKDKVAIVTGGGTGIGKAISIELLYLGCKVIIASRKKEILSKAVDKMCVLLKDRAPDVCSIVCDIRKENEVQNLVAETLKRYGKIDFLVNNGGGQFLSPAADITSRGWDAVVETNLKGPFLLSKEVYCKWMKDHGGSIVNILMDFERGVPLMAHSGAARSGLDNLTKSLAVEWAADGIRINAVAPGHSIYSETAAKNYPINVFDMAKDRVPAKRLGLPEEVSSAVCFLLSPGASFISGETLHVDAGGRLYSPLMVEIPDHNKLPPFTEDTGSKSKL